MGLTVIIEMPRTVVHAGSNGISPAFPDVCKTPSPGGPIPIPYLNIARSADTSQGSKKVKMDGYSIMLKSSCFSMSSGNEPGSAGGGVVSSKIKGKAKFANYSFNVKVEKKNVPRLLDPMQQNGNGANAIGADGQAANAISEAHIAALECDDDWDCCQRKQAMNKVKKMNKALSETKGGWHYLADRTKYKPRRARGNLFAARFKEEHIAGELKDVQIEWKDDMAPELNSKDFMHQCAYDEVKDMSDSKREKHLKKNFSADHIREIQVGGDPQGPLKLLDKDVNEKLGRDLYNSFNVNVKVVTLDCPCSDCSTNHSVQ